MRGKIAHLILLVAGGSVAVLNYIAFPNFLLAQVFAPQPMRLSVKAVQTTFPSGTKGQFWITFLDRAYQPTSNDIKRRIDLKLDSSVSSGMVELRQSVDALPGQKQVPVVFTPQKPGRVLIRIESKGLQSGSVFLTVSTAKKSALVPPALAQDSPRLDIFNSTPPVPANGTSVVGFYVTLDGPSQGPTSVRIDSNPPCVLLYAGENTRPANGSITIVIPPEAQQSLEVQARTSQSGTVRLLARALPQGPVFETTLTFLEPQPSSLAFEEIPLSISLSGGRLGIQIADQNNISLRSFSGSWNVNAKASNNADPIRFDPDQFTLSGQTPARDVFLHVTDMPRSEDLLVYATTSDGSLRAAEKKLGFESSLGRLKVIVPLTLNRGDPTTVKAQFLLKGQEREAHTEFPRKVQFFSNGGKFEQEEVMVEKDAAYASSVFVGHELGPAEIRVSTPGVDIAQITVLLVVSLGQLVAIALASGSIGGLARFFYYREQSWGIWPQKTRLGWHPGAVGNAAFSGVFGVVMLLMTHYGLIQLPLESEHLKKLSASLIHTNGGAFLLGIAGGFIGVAVLELLAKRLGLADALVFRRRTSHVVRRRDRGDSF
jgi:hypothetical protein